MSDDGAHLLVGGTTTGNPASVVTVSYDAATGAEEWRAHILRGGSMYALAAGHGDHRTFAVGGGSLSGVNPHMLIAAYQNERPGISPS
jgi:hypothetical protein